MKKINNIQNLQLEGGIHTFELMTSQVPELIPEDLRPCVKVKNYTLDTHTGEYSFKAIINPNKYSGYISCFSDFKKISQDILLRLGIDNYTIKRVDFRLDSREDNYNELLKINKILILLLGFKYKTSRYQSIEPLSLDQLTIRIQNSSFEVENYNKKLQSDGLDEVQNRLELRKKRLYYIDLNELEATALYWKIRLANCLIYYNSLQKMCNDALLKRWKQEKEVQVNTQTEFIRKYQQNIFTCTQLKELLSAMGIENSQKAAYNLAYTNQIQYISPQNIDTYIEKIALALMNFLKS